MQEVEHLIALQARLEVIDRHDQWRLGDDPCLSVNHARQFREGRHAVLGARLGELLLGFLHDLGLELRGELLNRALDVQVRVPDVEVLHAREPRHRGAVLLDGVKDDPLLVLDGEAAVARGDQHAHGKALDIPLPRPRERLVEVVDVEHQPALGRGKRAEVRQVRVTAALHGEARVGRRRQIAGHDQRRTPIEGERRDQHAPVADRHELRHPRLGLALEQLDRINAARRRLEDGVARARNLGPCGLAASRPLGDSQMRYCLRGRVGRRRHELGRDDAVIVDDVPKHAAHPLR